MQQLVSVQHSVQEQCTLYSFLSFHMLLLVLPLSKGLIMNRHLRCLLLP